VWASLWDRLGTLADDTERLNLDRKQAVLTGLSWLARP
jgi:DNA polymerase-3 subunit delta'